MIAIDLLCYMNRIIEAFACSTHFEDFVLGKVEFSLDFRAGDVDAKFDLAGRGVLVLALMAVCFE